MAVAGESARGEARSGAARERDGDRTEAPPTARASGRAGFGWPGLVAWLGAVLGFCLTALGVLVSGPGNARVSSALTFGGVRIWVLAPLGTGLLAAALWWWGSTSPNRTRGRRVAWAGAGLAVPVIALALRVLVLR